MVGHIEESPELRRKIRDRQEPASCPSPRRHLVSSVHSCPSPSSRCPAPRHCLLGSVQYLIHLCPPVPSTAPGREMASNRPMGILSSMSLDLMHFYSGTDLSPPGATRGHEEAGSPEILIFPSFPPTACHPITDLQLLDLPLSFPRHRGEAGHPLSHCRE